MILSFGNSVVKKCTYKVPLSFQQFADLDLFTKPASLDITKSEFVALSNKAKLNLKDHKYFMASLVDPDIRNLSNAKIINLITIDIENQSLRPVPPDLPFNYIFHPTLNHTSEDPRYHLIVESDGSIPVELYKEATLTLSKLLGIKANKETRIAIQPFFFPKLFSGSEYKRIYSNGKKPFGRINISNVEVVAQRLKKADKSSSKKSKLLKFIKPPISDFSLDNAREVLKYINPDLGYANWIFVAAALRHQFPDHPGLAYEIFDYWSSNSQKYPGSAETYRTFSSFVSDPADRKPATMRLVIEKAKLKGYSQSGGKIPECDRTRQAPISASSTPADFPSAGPPADEVHQSEAAVEASERSEEAKCWYDDMIYITSHDEFYCRKRNKSWRSKTFDRVFSRELTHQDQEALKVISKPRHLPSDFCMNVLKVPTVDSYCFLPTPSEQQIIQIEDKEYLNRYKPPKYLYKKFSGEFTDTLVNSPQYKMVTDRLQEQLDWMFYDPIHQEIFMSYLAYNVQNPQEKIIWSIILQGAQGCGKTFWSDVMSVVLGQDNVSNIGVEIFEGNWNDWAINKQMIFVEEMKAHGANKWKLMDKLKPHITNPRIRISERFIKSYDAINTVNYILLTDYSVPAPLAADDRRYCYLRCKVQHRSQKSQKPPDYFKKLFEVLKFEEELTLFFRNYRIPESFKPKGEAPRTEFNKELERQSLSDIEHYITEQIAEGQDPLINEVFVDFSHLRDKGKLSGDFDHNTMNRKIARALTSLGYKVTDRRRYNKVLHTFWRNQAEDLEVYQEKLDFLLKTSCNS